MRVFKAFAAFFTVFLLLLSLSLPALAQASGVSLVISPLPIQLSAKPGTSTSADLRVRNAGTQDEKLKVSLRTFSVEGTTGKVVLHNPTAADDFLNWVSFDRTVFNAPAGQ